MSSILTFMARCVKTAACLGRLIGLLSDIKIVIGPISVTIFPMETFKEQHVEGPEPVEIPESAETNENLATSISERLDSPSFKEKLLELPPESRDAAIGMALEYSVLHKDGFDFDKFTSTFHDRLLSLGEKHIYSGKKESMLTGIYIESVAKKLSIERPFQEDDEKRIFTHIADNLIVDGYVYHGFNGSFEESIRENGLDPQKVMWDIEDLKGVSAIGSAHGNPMLLGWHSANGENDSFYNVHPFGAYHYAVASPEWFGQFTAEGFHVPVEGNAKSAFYRRDYEAAKANVLNACKKMRTNASEGIDDGKPHSGITEEEEAKILALFEKYWPRLAGETSDPKVALIKRIAFQDVDTLRSRYGYAMQKQICIDRAKRHPELYPDGPRISIEEMVEDLLNSNSEENNIGTKDAIQADSIMIVDLPRYADIHPEEM